MKFAGFQLRQPPTSWLTVALAGQRPQEVLPRVFPACVRVLHPARFPNEYGNDIDLSWAYIHETLGDPGVHVGPEPSLVAAWDEMPRAKLAPPQVGTLPEAQTWQLIDGIEPELTDPSDCWFAVWDGFGCLRDPRQTTTHRLHLRGGDYLTLHAPLYLAARPLCAQEHQGVNLWWGPEATWCVYTDVELDSTLVAGSHALVQRVMDDPALETLPVTS